MQSSGLAAGPRDDPYAPPPTIDQFAALAQRHARERNRKAGAMLGVGSAVHFLAVPVGLVLFKAFVEAVAGFSVTWGEIWDALAATGGMGIFLLGVGGQLGFGILGAAFAILAYRGRSAVGIPAIVVGVIGIIFSFAVFGGLVGAIGGILVAAGGARAKSAPQRMMAPPPFRPFTPPPPPAP